MKQQYIHILIERFLNAETSLQEEQQLYDFFAQDDIPSDLEPYREMFRDLGCLKEDEGLKSIDIISGEEDTVSTPNTINIKPKILRWHNIGVAASIAALLISGLFLHNWTSDDYAVAYINGQKVTDDAMAVQMGTEAISDIFNSNDGPADELYDIFNPEQQ